MKRSAKRDPTRRASCFPDTPTSAYAEQGLEAGAAGFIVKGDSSEICDAIRKVLDGEIYLSRSLTKSGAKTEK